MIILDLTCEEICGVNQWVIVIAAACWGGLVDVICLTLSMPLTKKVKLMFQIDRT